MLLFSRTASISRAFRSASAVYQTQLRDRSLELVMQNDDVYESYHPETGELPKAVSIFGWTFMLFIDLAIKASHGTVI